MLFILVSIPDLRHGYIGFGCQLGVKECNCEQSRNASLHESWNSQTPTIRFQSWYLGTRLSPVLHGMSVTAILSPVRRRSRCKIWSNPLKAKVISVHDTNKPSWQQEPIQRSSVFAYSSVGSWRDDSTRATVRDPTTFLQFGAPRNHQPLSGKKPQELTVCGRAPYVSACKQRGQLKARQWHVKKHHLDGNRRNRFSTFKQEDVMYG